MPPYQRLAILFAVPQELGPAGRLLQPASTTPPNLGPLAARQGRWRDHELLLVVGGMGQKRAGAAAEAIVRAWKPDLLVMAGVGGALAPDLQVADVIAADAVIAGDEVLRPTLIPALPSGSHRTGALLSLNHVLVSAEDKRRAVASLPHHATSGAQALPLAVEMETAAVARIASHHQVPWAAVRVVSDTASESLPLDFNRLRTPDGDLPTARVALAAITHPGAIPGLIRLGKNTSLAAEALARFLERWVSAL
jgi:nucleoside phosphorylase